FEMAHELIRKKIHDPESRSALMKSLALQAVQAGRAVEAGGLLETERLKPEDRFEVLLKIADSLDEGEPGTLKEKKAVLEDAQRDILLHEFQSASRRMEGLIQLGLRLAKLNQLKGALDVFKEAESAIENSIREAPIQDKEKTELILARFEAFVLPLIQGDSTLHFTDLYEALMENRQNEIPGLATLLGFRTDTFYSALKSLDVLEFGQRAPVKAWLLLGASLRPMEREEKKKTAEKVLAALQRVSHSEAPESARLQRILIRALWNLAPQRLENFLLQL